MSESTTLEGSSLESPSTSTSAFERLVDVLILPKQAFDQLGARSSYVLPIIVIIACRFASILLSIGPSHEIPKLVISLLIATILPLFFITATSVGLSLLLKFGRGAIPFETVFSVVAYCTFAYELVRFLWGLVEVSVFGLTLPGGQPVHTDLAFLVAKDDYVTQRIASAADITVAYLCGLLVVGLHRAGRDVSAKAAGLAVVGGWFAYTFIGVLIKFVLTR